jgi:hypothetical protein
MKVNLAQISVVILFIGALIVIVLLGQTKDVISSECIVLEENDENKVDILFIGHGYTEKDKFLEEVNEYVYGEFGYQGVEPFKSNFDKLNFYGILSDDVQCPIQSDTIICDDLSTRQVASQCPHNFIIVLNNRNLLKDFIVPVRSSAYLNVASINTADNKLVVVHEFAHIFRNLADEYVEESIQFEVEDFDNCDLENCPVWRDFEGAGCFAGCGMAKYQRSIDTGIMRNYVKSKEFGNWNEKLLSERLA